MKLGFSVRKKVRQRLNDPTKGFNALVKRMAPDFEVPPFSVDFRPKASSNYIEAQANFDEVVGTGRLKASPALVMLYTTRLTNPRDTAIARLEGLCEVSLDVYLAWPLASIPRDSEDYGDLVEAVLAESMMDQANKWWGDDAAFNGELTIGKGPLDSGADHWLRTIAARMTFLTGSL